MKFYKVFALVILTLMSISFAYTSKGQGIVRDAVFTLSADKQEVKKGDMLTLTLNLENPSKQNITSFIALVKYDTGKLKGIKVDPGEKPIYEINLYTNDEAAFLENKSIARLGRATISDIAASGKTAMEVGKITFQVGDVSPNENLSFEFVQGTSQDIEETSANVVVNDTAENILGKGSLKPLLVRASGNASSVAINQNTIPENTMPVNTNQNTLTTPSSTNESPTNTAPSISLGSSENTNSFADLAPVRDTSTEELGIGGPERGVETNEKLGAVPTTPANGPAEMFLLLFAVSIATAFGISISKRKLL